MMRSHRTEIAFAAALGLGLGFLAACSDDDDDDGPPAGAGLLQQTERAVAPDGMAGVKTQRFAAVGKRYDHLEAFSPTSARGYEQLNYTSDVAVDLDGEAHHGTWDSTTVEVIPGTHRNWVEVSARGLGYVTGQDGAFPPAGAGAPMQSARVAARWKE